MLKVISSLPSPYARKVRIALAEKGIPFELITEMPWGKATQTPQHNPLEKVPIVIFEDGKTIYESSYILDYLEAKFPNTVPLLPQGSEHLDEALHAKQIAVVANGICDALLLLFFEKQRDEEKRSELWMDRQQRKVDGGIKAIAGWLGDDERKDYFVMNQFGLADIAVGSMLGWLKLRFPDHPWQQMYPNLARYSDSLEQRPSFTDSIPKPQYFNEAVV